MYISGCSVPFFGPLSCLYYLIGVTYNKAINDSKKKATLVGMGLSFLVQLLFWWGLLLSGKANLIFLFYQFLT